MKRVSVALVTAALMVSVVLISACSINESPVEELGAVYVSVMDTSLAIVLEDSQVLVNDVPRAQNAPAVIDRIPAGEVEVTVRPGLLYPPRTQTVTVIPPETSEVSFLYSAADLISTVTINSNTADAVIVIDEMLQPDLVVGEPFEIAAGLHTISLYKDSHITLAPSLFSQELIGSEEYEFTLDLEQVEYGNVTGELFPDFTFDNDWGGENTLGQYRGQVVLVTFWFSTCTPCREEFPVIEQVFQERAVEGFRVLGVNNGQTNDGQEEFEAIRQDLDLSFPLLFNGYGPAWIWQDLELIGAPTNFILSPSGLIHARLDRKTDYEELNGLIDEAFGG